MTAHLIHAWGRRLRGAARLGGLRNGARGKRFAVFHPTSGACRPGDRAALVGGRRVDDGAASSMRGFAGCEGPPGSVVNRPGFPGGSNS